METFCHNFFPWDLIKAKEHYRSLEKWLYNEKQELNVQTLPPLNITPCISNFFSLIDISKANSISSNSSVQQKLGKVFLPLFRYLAKNMNGRNSMAIDMTICFVTYKLGRQ